MVTVASLLVFLLVVTFDVWFWVARPRFRRRSMAMAAVMLLFATVWTCSAVATGSRWVEVNGATGAPVTAPPAVTIAALAYDVIVEIVLAYVPFFAIPALLGLIPASPRTSLAPGREEVPA